VRRWTVIVALLLVVSLFGLAYRWVNQPLTQSNSPSVDLSIEAGTSARMVAQGVSEAGVEVDPSWLYWYFRLSGQSRLIKAGSYELEAGLTPATLLQKLVRGEQATRSVTLVEGWTFAQVRQALAKAEHLKPDTAALTGAQIMALLGAQQQHPEGRFFPDTYSYAKGSNDLNVLKRAYQAMDRQVAEAWAQRAPDVAITSPEQLLNLASIVEKETGRSSDRPMIAGVFSNRLRIGMLLQTDPTVIYGLGEAFNGNLRKRDLLADTPYNTYTRAGLPPTPIAMPGKSSLQAAANPAPTKALYFVARGDGSSQFSATLDEHNRAVNQFQRAH
jgi:UPF0755 protein